MAYTKLGPFINASTTPPLNATFANGIETELVALDASVSAAVTAATSAQTAVAALRPQSARNAITGWWHVDDFGAVHDGVTSDRAAAQAAIDAANAYYGLTGSTTRQVVHFGPYTYAFDVTNFITSNGSTYGICSLWLRDGVELRGPAHLRLLNNQYGNGAFYGMIRTQTEGANNIAIRDLMVDGNRANQTASTNAGNILIEANDRVTLTNVESIESNGNGIMVRGSAYGTQATSIRVEGCYVYGVNGIGIQVSQFDGLLISRCTVLNTSDNGIDVYGEYGNVTTTSHGTNFQINDNNCRNCGTGIFLETVAYGVVVGNRVSNCPVGLRVNRINGQPTSLGIRANSFFGCATGAAFSGVHVDVSFLSNEIQSATTAGIKFDGQQSAGLFGFGNLITTSASNVPLIQAISFVSTLSKVYIAQTMTDSSGTTTFSNSAGSSPNVSVATAVGPF